MTHNFLLNASTDTNAKSQSHRTLNISFFCFVFVNLFVRGAYFGSLFLWSSRSAFSVYNVSKVVQPFWYSSFAVNTVIVEVFQWTFFLTRRPVFSCLLYQNHFLSLINIYLSDATLVKWILKIFSQRKQNVFSALLFIRWFWRTTMLALFGKHSSLQQNWTRKFHTNGIHL